MNEWKEYEREDQDTEKSSYYYTESIKPANPKKKSSWKKILILVLIVGFVGGISISIGIGIGKPLAQNVIKPFLEQFNKAWTFQEDSPSSNEYVMPEKEEEQNNNISPITSTGQKSPVVEIAKKVGPSVVAVNSSITVRDWFNNPYSKEGTGSGVIFGERSDEVFIVTNHHVIDQATKVTVTLLGDHTVPAYLKGYDPQTDLAVIYIKKSEIPAEIKNQVRPAQFGDSDELEAGELAVAIGNPLGTEFNNTVTVGVISAVNRQLTLPDKTMTMIQTDAAINPGNSGGALVNGSGEVIGINTVKLVDAKVEGMGFAIPINNVKPIIEELVNRGSVLRPGLGVLGSDIDKDVSSLYEIPIGILVREVVPGSAADAAGIRQGDIIIGMENQKITSMDQLTKIIKNHKVGDVVEITIVRDFSTKKVVKAKLQNINQ